MESAMISRLMSEPRIPSVPMEMASETVMVPNSKGEPPDARTPTLISSTSGLMPALQGVTSLWVEATPTNGASISASDMPIARIMERWGARITPSVVSQDRHLPGARPFRLLPARLVDCVAICSALSVKYSRIDVSILRRLNRDYGDLGLEGCPLARPHFTLTLALSRCFLFWGRGDYSLSVGHFNR